MHFVIKGFKKYVGGRFIGLLYIIYKEKKYQKKK